MILEIEMAAVRILQFNMNHSPGAQDLALQYMTEENFSIGCFSEPWRIPDKDGNWYSSVSKRAAIFCSRVDVTKKCRLSTSSEDWVAMAFGDIIVISYYLSPNEGIIRFKKTLDEIRIFIGDSIGKVLLCGDFNARSVHWGCHTNNMRGMILEDWVSELNLSIINFGNVSTCVRPQGSSVVDLTMASPWVALNVRDWHVKSDMETLSDNTYISFTLNIGFAVLGGLVKHRR